LKRLSIDNLWLRLEIDNFGLNEENYLSDITNFTKTINMYSVNNDETTSTLFYKKENLQVDPMGIENINSLKKILIERYLLSHNIILTDKFMKPYSDYKIISNMQMNIYISLNYNGLIRQTNLKRTKYVINSVHRID
jgi:hypothetical protein